VMSRSGQVLGGLFFAHPETAVFDDRAEQIASGLAAQAAVSIDNVLLFQEVRRERDAARVARDQAESANVMKDQFLMNLSHELRTPLNAILGWAGLLETGRLKEHEIQHAITVILRNAQDQARLIEDILDVSRILAGKLKIESQLVELIPVAQTAIEALRPAAEVNGVALEHSLECTRCAVWGDPVRLQQVVWNLLSNAIKFTPPEGRVHVALREAASHIEIVVSDTGEGISADFLSHVFDRFRQADESTTRRHGGLGLGLAIVKYLVEAQGGTIKADSEGTGKGATFTVTLPVAIPSPALYWGTIARASFGAQELATGTLRGITILAVDDDPDTLELITHALEACEAQVLIAASTEQALDLLRHYMPHALISDIGMPLEDGYDLIRKVRSLGLQIPAVALTAYASSGDRQRVIDAGFQVHLTKPVSSAELIAALQQVLGQ
jgi:signal transduction histidine kinase